MLCGLKILKYSRCGNVSCPSLSNSDSLPGDTGATGFSRSFVYVLADECTCHKTFSTLGSCDALPAPLTSLLTVCHLSLEECWFYCPDTCPAPARLYSASLD